MTIEANLASIAKSLEIIAAIVQNRNIIEPVPAAAPVAAPVVAAPAVVPNVQPAPIPVAPVMVTPVVMPIVTTPVAAVATPAAVSPSDAVFANHTAFVEFVMNSYKTLGPIKGAKIQDVLTASGVKNINDVQASMYAAVKSGIEALLA